MSNMIWKLGTTAAAILGGVAAKKVSELIWKKASGKNTPDDPADPAMNWGQTMLFAALSGTLVQVIRVVIKSQSTRTYINATGQHPADDVA